MSLVLVLDRLTGRTLSLPPSYVVFALRALLLRLSPSDVRVTACAPLQVCKWGEQSWHRDGPEQRKGNGPKTAPLSVWSLVQPRLTPAACPP